MFTLILLSALGHDSYQVREWAQQCLMSMPGKGALPIIEVGLKSTDLEVRSRSQAALNSIDFVKADVFGVFEASLRAKELWPESWIQITWKGGWDPGAGAVIKPTYELRTRMGGVVRQGTSWDDVFKKAGGSYQRLNLTTKP